MPFLCWLAELRAKYGLASIALDGSQRMLQDGPGTEVDSSLARFELEGTSAGASTNGEAAPGRVAAETERIAQSVSANSAASREDDSNEGRAPQQPGASRAEAAAAPPQRIARQGRTAGVPSEASGSEAELRRSTHSSAACTVDESSVSRGPGCDGLPDLDWRQLEQMLCNCGFPALPLHVRSPC